MVNDLYLMIRLIPGDEIVMFADYLVILVSADNMQIIESTMNGFKQIKWKVI